MNCVITCSCINISVQVALYGHWEMHWFDGMNWQLVGVSWMMLGASVTPRAIRDRNTVISSCYCDLWYNEILLIKMLLKYPSHIHDFILDILIFFSDSNCGNKECSIMFMEVPLFVRGRRRENYLPTNYLFCNGIRFIY